MTLKALDIFLLVDALPVTPLRAAIIELLGDNPEIDTHTVAELMGHNDRARALTDLTKLRRQGFLLNRPEPPTGTKGKPRMQWRLSAKGKRVYSRVKQALQAFR